ncbi:membrane protein insertase YidC [Pseudoblastomonas halimionae]|uniref:Membrane protein insertase YidC n=1 Tax=Alteriqipengyuania halimionae TaxID=1926630 RepID=A0A6I4U795_9SPHN|nr:membrane protein insertase YidC [Alteriqipengyuania halimionae]MXP10241.1 membrane protein insertase YidC [Alteriqipengyuania halimionae]
MNDNRNLIIAVILSALVLFGWDAVMNRFYPQPDTAVEVAEAVDAPVEGAASAPPAATSGPAPGTATQDAPIHATQPKRDLDTELASAGRVEIEAPSLAGSINLKGALIDDLVLRRHTTTIEDGGEDPVRLLAPAGTEAQYFAQFGWVGSGASFPDSKTVWEVADDARLTPETPVTLQWTAPDGTGYAIRFEIDDDYMIQATQTVANRGSNAMVAQPFAVINRTDRFADNSTWIMHTGPIGAFDDAVEFGIGYDDVEEAGTARGEGDTDWIGFTDHYWLSALIPQQGASTDSDFRTLGNTLFRADLVYDPSNVAAGATLTRTTDLFAGAKEDGVLDAYEDAGIANFGHAIDWGWFEWFERPFLWILKQLYALSGNFGVAIILLTVLIRAALFPIAQKQFASMAAMRAIQPKMKALQERYKDDKPKMQQEVMALYKKEKVNPLGGCLPIFIQMPIFFALYKVLMLSVELRHKPFVLWIKDLSAPDPAHVLNLFGLLPFDPPGLLAIGPLAILLGITMYFQFSMNPISDPVQEKIFKFMPWVLMFVMAPFAAGLLLYWVTNNILTLAQQKYLYSKNPQLREMALKEREEKRKALEAKG